VTEAQQPTAISVMLIVADAEAAVAWYKGALGATELWNLGGVAGLEIEGAPFFLHEVNPSNPAEDSPDRIGVTSTRIELFVDDPDGVRERAIAAGASPGSDVRDHQRPWGTHRQGGFRDPFGHNWSVGDRSPLRPQ
jgi:PhnB protein